jgi:hypothetical protein
MSLTVTRSDGTSDIVFTLQNQVGTQYNYSNASAGLVEPEQITLQSFLRPLGAKGTDRYILKASKTFVEDTTGNNITISARLELAYPRTSESGALTSLKDQIAFIKSMLSAANITALAAGSLPTGDNHVDVFNPA